jgi:phage terminase large subunit-like protein
MGQRGIGSRKARQALAVAAQSRGPQPWQASGLSRAQRVMMFLESLPITKGYGEGAKLKLMPFQREWLEAVYREDDAGRRVVSTGLLSAGRGNGKTVLTAGLCLAHLVGPERVPRAEVYSAAVGQQQAALIFAEIEAWCLRVPWLEHLNVRRQLKQIEDLTTGDIYRALASDAPAVHGLAPSFVAADELAMWKRREMYEVLRTALGKRPETLMVVISTQSAKADNVLSELIDYGLRIDAGVIEDDSFHGRLYTVPEEADPFDESLWAQANPGVGVIRSLEEMRQEARRAQRMPAFASAFRNLYLNQRIEAEARAIDKAEWAACAGSVDPVALRGRPCWGGLDLSSTRDVTALALYFPDDGGRVLMHFWIPKEGMLERESGDRVPYAVWAQRGLITATPGKAVNKRWIAMRLAQLAAEYRIEGIAFDRWGRAELDRIFDEEGVTLPLVDHGQGYKDMGPAVNAFEAALIDGRLQHGANPVLNWMSDNLIYETDPAGNRKPSKSRSIDRIDGMAALIMAIGLHVKAPPESDDRAFDPAAIARMFGGRPALARQAPAGGQHGGCCLPPRQASAPDQNRRFS